MPIKNDAFCTRLSCNQFIIFFRCDNTTNDITPGRHFTVSCTNTPPWGFFKHQSLSIHHSLKLKPAYILRAAAFKFSIRYIAPPSELEYLFGDVWRRQYRRRLLRFVIKSTLLDIHAYVFTNVLAPLAVICCATNLQAWCDQSMSSSSQPTKTQLINSMTNRTVWCEMLRV